jgi:hypothetical protein
MLRIEEIMKASSKTLLVTLLGLSILGFTAAGNAVGEETTAQPQAQTATSEEVTTTESTPSQTSESVPTEEGTTSIEDKETETNPSKTSEPAPTEETVEEQLDPTEYQFVPPDEGAEKAKTPRGVTKIPVTGAFGITLGEKFEPYMVSKILGKTEKTYKGRDEQKTEHTGTQYQVEPHVPNPNFSEYTVLTNKDGIIYSIIGKQISDKPVNRCEETKQIAIFLMDKYGTPRGRGILGEWFAFRESLEGPYRGLRFYAQRCRNGRYSIVYSDDGAMMQEASEDEQQDEMKGL